MGQGLIDLHMDEDDPEPDWGGDMPSDEEYTPSAEEGLSDEDDEGPNNPNMAEAGSEAGEEQDLESEPEGDIEDGHAKRRLPDRFKYESAKKILTEREALSCAVADVRSSSLTPRRAEAR
jgi:hypothetical protein